MTIREEFEKRFQVPPNLVWNGIDGYSDAGGDPEDFCYESEFSYNAKWIGFQAGAKRKQCVWTYCDDEMAWESECGGMLQMEDSPKESEFEYCCYCGGELVEAGDA